MVTITVYGVHMIINMPAMTLVNTTALHCLRFLLPLVLVLQISHKQHQAVGCLILVLLLPDVVIAWTAPVTAPPVIESRDTTELTT